jgi:hypothetical protein
MAAMNEPQILIVPLEILIGLLAPLYALVAGFYVLLFKHSTNIERHSCDFDQNTCNESKEQIRDYIKDVDLRSAKAIDDLKHDINIQFNRLFAELTKK